MSAPTFLAKHPAYLRYIREVASGELVMLEYERNCVIFHVGEQYRRYAGCPASDHVGRHSEDLEVADGVIGRITYIELQKVQAWYNSLFASVADPTPSSPSPSVTVSNGMSNRNST
ncbi:uncharacterized protein N7487_004382 [Penicillium crustosum]|uniref:uncharacterized protein n=1 Tax=Penicillium crustosum TaxID=36656 RepID=UPI00239748D0|nr:uncharacterized protein N7487_004382 [Penicillium crustosum]KAJ5410023.1 hypothetical protein N7487_004382 [Penicillium crustosum]